ncbi:hypothetical protein [Micromonospora radicis]|uniref:Uncharacterized protein n=1 Tax=Micromonospora radicis TaxID=1894971 RepID=A0A418MVA6_9ACTN|nr:hypothetical protein [Micromonospora radicis]RIV38423.1 hypothetical protein D2L64_12845 [Micromonospora radicis]
MVVVAGGAFGLLLLDGDDKGGDEMQVGQAASGGVASLPVGEPTPGADAGELPSSSSEPTVSMPVAVGLVTIVESALSDPRAADVAAMFDSYFGGINNGDHRQAAALFDPAGKVLDPRNEEAVERFGLALATTRDSDIVLRAVRDADRRGALWAEVTFRSEQAPGYGPKGREEEICTRWRIRYELSVDPAYGYRILHGKAAPSSPC